MREIKPSTLRESIEKVSLSYTERLHVLEAITGAYVHTRIEQNAARAAERALIANLQATHGGVGVIVDSTDCDHCRSTYGRVMDASEFPEWLDRLYANAEGPTHYRLVSPQYALLHRSSSRDLVLEAFEDGHSHVVFG